MAKTTSYTHIPYEPDMGECKVMNILQSYEHYVSVYKAKGHCSYVSCELPVAKFQFPALAVPYTRKLGGGFNLTI